jgi:hypothetical protein
VRRAALLSAARRQLHTANHRIRTPQHAKRAVLLLVAVLLLHDVVQLSWPGGSAQARPQVVDLPTPTPSATGPGSRGEPKATTTTRPGKPTKQPSQPVEVRVTQRPVRLTGLIGRAPYEIRVPKNWTGTLVVYAHGLRNVPRRPIAPGQRPVDSFLSDKAEEALLARGYALAGSGYSADGWAVPEGIVDTHRLIGYFKSVIGKPRVTLLAGFSMGSVIALSEAERSDLYDGVLAGCPMGAGTPRTVDTMLTLALAYDAVFGWPKSWGTPFDVNDNLDFEQHVQPLITRQFLSPGGPAKFELIRVLAGIPKGPEWLSRVWGFATESRANIERRAGGQIVQNLDHSYAVSPTDRQYLNRLGMPNQLIDHTIARMSTRVAPGKGRDYVYRYGVFTGRIKHPVLTLATGTDALVPASHITVYRATVAAAGRSSLLASAWTKGRDHCAFSPKQLATAVNALNVWVRTGQKPVHFPASEAFHPIFFPPAWTQP